MYRAIIASTNQPSSSRTPGYAPDERLWGLSNPDPLSCVALPYLYTPQITPARQEASVWTPGDPLKNGVIGVNVSEHLEANTCTCVPQLNGVIVGCASKKLPI